MIIFLDALIWYATLAVAIATPLFFTTANTELYEVPKMYIVYFGTTIVFFATILKSTITKKVVIPQNPVLLSLLVFLAANVISTIFSVDKFTSIFGYPSRLNGGLLSLIAYTTIFYSVLVNLSKQQSQKLIKVTVATALVVALWGIPSHFGKDPSCLILAKQLTSACWQKDFNPEIRIFSTLGQPNWLAQYLVFIIPFSLIFVFTSKKPYEKVIYSTASLSIVAAFIFTNSRSGLLGFTVSLLVLFPLLGTQFIKKNLKIILPFFLLLVVSSGFFGTTLVARVQEIFNPQTDLNIAGTESTQIRKIVWEGALNVFKKNPLLGTGPETFAYSYYKSRPLTHNQTTEWNFFYNKAHNEFLNYLASLGLLGFFSYTAFLLSIVVVFLKSKLLVSKATLAAIVGYHTTIFFGFSTVASQTLMFSIIAAVIIVDGQKLKTRKITFLPSYSSKIAFGAITIASLWTFATFLRMYLADTFAQRAENSSSSAKASLNLASAIESFPTDNPFYLSSYANSTALYATQIEDPSLAQDLARQADIAAEKALMISPNNVITLRRIANAYISTSTLVAANLDKAKSAADKIILLAPTDPQSYLTNAKAKSAAGNLKGAKENLIKALELKPDYLEAKQLLDQITAKEIE